jgi:hypothetical protein
MIKLPAREDGRWTVQYSNDKMPDIVGTRNLTFDRDGYIRLSKPTISYYSDVDDSDFGLPLLHANADAIGIYHVCTNEAIFELNMVAGTGGYVTVAQSSATGVPSTSTSYPELPGAVVFNKLLHYSIQNDIYSRNSATLASDWTDRNVTGLEVNRHPLVNFTSNATLAVGDGNNVEQYNTAYSAGTTLVIPANVSVTGMAYNNGYLGITTTDFSRNGQGMFFVWDGKTAAANFSYAVGCSVSSAVIPYKGTFAFLTGNGQLMYWTGAGIETLADLPSYFTNASLFTLNADCCRQESAYSEGEVIYINIDSTLSGATENGDTYLPNQNGGIWCFDPMVGLYHKSAPTGTKVIVDVIPTSDVDTTANTLTVTASYPSGTPVRYSSAGGTAIAGLADGALYYTILVDATTIKLAETYTNATATTPTAIDLTGTGGDAQTLQFYPKPDFGQSYLTGQQGVVQILEETERTGDGLYFSGLFYGSNCAQKTTTSVKVGGYALKDSENRGYFVTSKLQSVQLQEDWQKIFVKHSKLVSDLDKIVIKYKTASETDLVVRATSKSGTITWTDSDTFTTTDTQWANVQAGDEVEVIQGAGSGYLLHVSSISETGGTYTVNLDEAVKNISASDTGRAIVSRWNKLTTLTSGTITNEDGYSEITIGVKSKSIQFKIELRGEDVEIEEILVAHQLHKPVA